MNHTDVMIETPDGKAPACVFHPAGSGPWPTVLFYMDGLGIRPALFEMARRLASEGYYVLLPDLYYRSGSYAPFDAKSVFGSPDSEERTRLMSLFSSLSQEKVMRDSGAFLAFLDRQTSASASKIGCVGYCMGGGFALSAAGTFPDRVAAAASFHGARLANDSPDSPHLLAPRMRARVYVGIAGIDPHFSAEEGERLRQALEAAGVDHRIETYPEVAHGFAVNDVPVYDAAAAERHWRVVLELFGETLTPATV